MSDIPIDVSKAVFARPVAVLLGVCLIGYAPAACTVSPPRQMSEKSLIDEDAAIFDRRFRGVDPADLELSDFWIEGQSPPAPQPIAIHHRTFSDLVDSVSDGIVNIYTRGLRERQVRVGVSPNDILPIRIPIVSDVLDIVPFKVPIPFRTEGFSLGSGFLINRHGYLLTNAHVVQNATDIRIVRAGRRQELPASIIGLDRLTDTALLRIEPQPDMTVLPLGDSDALRVGEMVIAVGNPLGLNHTVTSGLVSAKERVLPVRGTMVVDFLQTDSAINPGSSGGPLLNVRGEVVGINTAIASDAQSIGFAIPIDIVKDIMPLLIVGKTDRGWFGAAARPFEPGEAQALGYPNPRGVVIEAVEDDSPAKAAGVLPDDVIVRIDDRDIESFVVFRRQILGLLPGQEIRLTLFRNGALREITSTLAANPGSG